MIDSTHHDITHVAPVAHPPSAPLDSARFGSTTDDDEPIDDVPTPSGGMFPPTLEPASRARLSSMFSDHHDFIWRLLRRLGLSSDRADDATQHVFIVAAERLDSIRRGSERAFLFGTALRVAKSSHRQHHRLQLEEDMDAMIGSRNDPEELADQRQALALLDRALGSLDLDLRTVFVLFELEGMTTPEIATLIDVPLGTAASRLRRAREAFRSAVATCQQKAGAR